LDYVFSFVLISNNHFLICSYIFCDRMAHCLLFKAWCTVARLSEVLILLVEVIIQLERQFIPVCACMSALCINIFVTYRRKQHKFSMLED